MRRSNRQHSEGDDLSAARWHARMNPGPVDEATHAAFARWQAEDPSHCEQYSAVDNAVRQAKIAADAPSILALRQETLARVAIRGQGRSRRNLMAASLALALVGTGAFVALRAGAIGPGQQSTQLAKVDKTYRTGVGERLTITLADGSAATLNTSSQLRVAYTGAERRIDLLSGQALFEVAKEKSRPFVVRAGGQTITAHGTQFDVRVNTAGLKVALLEGLVTVAAISNQGKRPIDLRPNDVLIIDRSGASVRPQVNAAELSSWRDGFLIFDDELLSDAVAEVNRYVDQRIVIRDKEVADLRISGAFRTGDTATFVEALEMSFPIEATRRTQDAIVLVSRD